MKARRELLTCMFILAMVAVFFSWRSPPPDPALTPSPASKFEIGGVRLGENRDEVVSLLGKSRKDTPGELEWSSADKARVQTVDFNTAGKSTSVTGTALSRDSKVVCQTDTAAASVTAAFGKPSKIYKWNKNEEQVWEYTQPWGTVEVHMNAAGTAVLHCRISDH